MSVRLDDLRFSYPPITAGARPSEVLRGVSLDVPAGQSIAIMGPNSSGKTTLALILAGLAPAMTGGALAGSVLVNGLDATTTPAATLSASIGLVFQEPERQLFNMTVAEEVAFGLEGQALAPREIGQHVAWALAQVGMTGLEERAPWQLSGGQQKRLAIATLLAIRPPVLLLDEPMAGLDPGARREIAAVLGDLHRTAGATIIVLEKDAEFVARWAERVVILADGQIALDGSPTDVFAKVERLHSLGVAVPQMAELAARLPDAAGSATFLTARQAAARLTSQLAVPVAAAAVAKEIPANRSFEHATLQGGVADATPSAIDVRNVTFCYEDGTRALDDLSLLVPDGQFLAVVGRNGGGKSTLARHLNGLLRPQNGDVAIRGKPAAGRRVGDLAKEIGYVFQNPDHQIFATSVREEVAYGLRNLGVTGEEASRRVDEALAVFGLADVAGTPPAVLGYGLRRLVTLASVWAMQPPIWVLDESTTGLDARYTATLMDRLRSLHAGGRTILFITHDLRLAAEFAERMVVIDRGQVALDGPPAAVFSDNDALQGFGLRPPPITRLSALLAPSGFAHPTLSVDQFVDAW
ncbi:MAG: ATP-binding cassette domain-containing protein [Anaerolineae bacterium]|nr:ATP-binding cassette domain-containing protein [Anaerolineae bacterium]